MRAVAAVAMLIAGTAAAPALAQETVPGRYAMAPAGDGILRLDTQTGAVSHCADTGEGWVCRSVADDRLALEAEIDRLGAENRRLRAELDTLTGVGPDRAPGATEPPPKPRSWLPDDRHVEEFMAFFEKLMRRFKGAVESLKQERLRREL